MFRMFNNRYGVGTERSEQMLGMNEQEEDTLPASVPDTAQAQEAWPCSCHLSFPWPQGGWLRVDRDQRGYLCSGSLDGPDLSPWCQWLPHSLEMCHLSQQMPFLISVPLYAWLLRAGVPILGSP